MNENYRLDTSLDPAFFRELDPSPFFSDRKILSPDSRSVLKSYKIMCFNVN